MSAKVSKGLVFSYLNLEGVEVEVYRDARGEWHQGSVLHVIDMSTGYRFGRWLGPARWAPIDVMRYLGLGAGEVRS